MERDKDEMQRLTEMLNDPNAEFQVNQGLNFDQKFETNFDFVLKKNLRTMTRKRWKKKERILTLFKMRLKSKLRKNPKKWKNSFFS